MLSSITTGADQIAENFGRMFGKFLVRPISGLFNLFIALSFPDVCKVDLTSYIYDLSVYLADLSMKLQANISATFII